MTNKVGRVLPPGSRQPLTGFAESGLIHEVSPERTAGTVHVKPLAL